MESLVKPKELKMASNEANVCVLIFSFSRRAFDLSYNPAIV